MENNIRTVLDWMGIVGIPTIFSVAMWCLAQCVKFAKMIKILHAAQKAQMRSQLLEQYYVIKERGWVWDTELIEWTNQYKAYHELVGDNAILDARKDELVHFTSKVRG